MPDVPPPPTGDVSERAPSATIAPAGRSKAVPLEWPVEFDGQTYETITVRRVTGLEVEAFLQAVAETAPGQLLQPPMIDCPAEVYRALDDDDRLTLESALLPFLPRRLRVGSASTPTTAATSSVS